MAVCDGYPGVGLRIASPIVLLLPSSLIVVSELAPDTAFHRGGTAQAPAPNECRAGLLLLLLQLFLARIRVRVLSYLNRLVPKQGGGGGTLE